MLVFVTSWNMLSDNKHNTVQETDMNMRKLTLASVLLTTSTIADANSFAIDARSLAMGNASVATANIATAALANPAMLVLQGGREDFALLLPAVGVYVDDSDQLIDAIDQFQVDSDACVANGNPASAACSAATASFNNLVGKALAPQVTGAVALGLSGDEYTFAFSARANASLAGGVDLTTVDTSPIGLQDPDSNIIELRGVATTEIGVSLATKLQLAGMPISIGITPKVVSVENVVFRESAASLDTGVGDLVDEDQVTDLGSFTTMDAGVMIGLTDNVQFGIVGRNLISEELVDNSGVTPVTLKFDPSFRAGIAYTGDTITLGVDLDLTENDPIITTFGAQKTQLLSIGAELDAFDIAQLRVGMQQNMADGANDDALITAGVGLWLGFTLDLSVLAGEDVFGAFLQTGFRW